MMDHSALMAAFTSSQLQRVEVYRQQHQQEQATQARDHAIEALLASDGVDLSKRPANLQKIVVQDCQSKRLAVINQWSASSLNGRDFEGKVAELRNVVPKPGQGLTFAMTKMSMFKVLDEAAAPLTAVCVEKAQQLPVGTHVDIMAVVTAVYPPADSGAHALQVLEALDENKRLFKIQCHGELQHHGLQLHVNDTPSLIRGLTVLRHAVGDNPLVLELTAISTATQAPRNRALAQQLSEFNARIVKGEWRARNLPSVVNVSVTPAVLKPFVNPAPSRLKLRALTVLKPTQAAHWRWFTHGLALVKGNRDDSEAAPSCSSSARPSDASATLLPHGASDFELDDSPTVQCPSCQSYFPALDIEVHVDSCLEPRRLRNGRRVTSSGSQRTSKRRKQNARSRLPSPGQDKSGASSELEQKRAKRLCYLHANKPVTHGQSNSIMLAVWLPDLNLNSHIALSHRQLLSLCHGYTAFELLSSTLPHPHVKADSVCKHAFGFTTCN
jgi:hypothetical protein